MNKFKQYFKEKIWPKFVKVVIAVLHWLYVVLLANPAIYILYTIIVIPWIVAILTRYQTVQLNATGTIVNFVIRSKDVCQADVLVKDDDGNLRLYALEDLFRWNFNDVYRRMLMLKIEKGARYKLLYVTDDDSIRYILSLEKLEN